MPLDGDNGDPVGTRDAAQIEAALRAFGKEPNGQKQIGPEFVTLANIVRRCN